MPPGGSVLRDVIFAVNQLIRGRSNATGTVTLTAGATTTTLTGSYNDSAQVFLTPKTENAAGSLDTTYAVVTNATTVTITHANAVSTDRTFAYAVIGG